jgi:hypothetical protein
MNKQSVYSTVPPMSYVLGRWVKKKMHKIRQRINTEIETKQWQSESSSGARHRKTHPDHFVLATYLHEHHHTAASSLSSSLVNTGLQDLGLLQGGDIVLFCASPRLPARKPRFALLRLLLALVLVTVPLQTLVFPRGWDPGLDEDHAYEHLVGLVDGIFP